MTRGVGRSAPLFTLCLAVSLFWSAPSFAQSQAPVPGASTTLLATVAAVDARAQTVDVVTGVGFALRVVKLGCGRTEFKTPGGGMSLAQLKPGDLVRVEYAKGVEGNPARTIEALAWPGGGK